MYFDATQVEVNADLDSLVPRFAVEAREAIQEHLAALFAPDAAISEAIEERNRNAPARAFLPEEKASPAPFKLPTPLSQKQREELTEENATRHDWMAEGGQPQREALGFYLRTSDVRISTTDPDATLMRLKGRGTHLGYHTHYVVDGGKSRIILAALVVPGEVTDNQPRHFKTHEEARSAIFEYIEAFYNRVRKHSTLG